MPSAIEPERPLPPAIIIGGGLVMAISLFAVASVRGGLAPRQPAAVSVGTASLDFRVVGPAGAQTVVAARDGRIVGPLSGKGDDFLPTLVTQLDRERVERHADPAAPLRLVRWADGRVSLQDPATGREMQLASFGSVNAEHARTLIAEGQGR